MIFLQVVLAAIAVACLTRAVPGFAVDHHAEYPPYLLGVSLACAATLYTMGIK